MSACAEATVPVATAPRKLRGEIPANPQSDALYAALRETVHGERGRAKVIADALETPYSHVTDLADPTRRVLLKAHEIVPIVRATNCTAILDALEQQVGRVAFALPTLPAHADEMQRELARNVSAFGEFLQENGEALADGTLEADEVATLTHSIDQMVAGLCEYRELVIDKGAADARRRA